MGSIFIAEFYKNVAAWPKAEAELGLAAEKVRELLDAGFAAIHVPALGTRSANGVPVEPVLAVIQEQAQRLENWQIRQIRVDRFPFPYLLVIRIIHKGRLEAGGPGRKIRRDFGWIATAMEKAPTQHEEALLTAAAERLANLAAIAELETMITVRDQFLSIASHELKTPLTSIYGMAQLQERMLRGERNDMTVAEYKAERSKQYGYLKIVLKQLQRLNELIDGLLDVSRIQNGRFMVEPTETDIAALAREAIQGRMEPIGQEAGVRIQAEIPLSLVAWVDPIRFEEVITNLVMNAIRFSPEGGVVWVKLKQDGDNVRFIVRDQGASVPDEDRARIFQPFERAKSAVRLGGLGLGLFISRQIAQLHGGDVVLSPNQPGHGNVFEARFPVKLAQRLSA